MLHSVSEYLSDCLVRIPPVILSSSPYLLVSLCLSQAGTVRALAAVVATPIQQLEVDTKQSFSLTMELELEDARMTLHVRKSDCHRHSEWGSASTAHAVGLATSPSSRAGPTGH